MITTTRYYGSPIVFGRLRIWLPILWVGVPGDATEATEPPPNYFYIRLPPTLNPAAILCRHLLPAHTAISPRSLVCQLRPARYPVTGHEMLRENCRHPKPAMGMPHLSRAPKRRSLAAVCPRQSLNSRTRMNSDMAASWFQQASLVSAIAADPCVGGKETGRMPSQHDTGADAAVQLLTIWFGSKGK